MTLYRDRQIHPRVKDLQRPRLGKPRRGLQIFDTRADFPVPVQSRGRFLYSCLSDRGIPRFTSAWKTLSFTSVHGRLPV